MSFALWIPTLWLLIIGSRLPSEWLGGGAMVLQDARSYTDGSPFDRTVFLVLIVGGASVLLTRRVPWASLLVRNWSIVLFFLFTLISILWSDYPLTALKRWTKVAGHVTMALVVLTADRPLESLSCLMRRVGFLLLPLSVLFIKYYPHLGRDFDPWTGAAVNLGVATNKNALGAICLILGPFFLASLVAGRTTGSAHSTRHAQENLICLVMAAWLLVMAESSAALGSSVVACGVILGLRLAPVRRHFFLLAGGSVALIVTLLLTTSLLPTLIEHLGEDLTLTGRTELWADLLTIPVNPFLGAGFESFWIGERIAWLWDKYWWQPNQAHNGFFETYLNLGIIGLGLQLLMLVVALANARRDLLCPVADSDVALATSQAAYKVAFVVGVTLFNLTDATFKAVHPLFFLFFLTAVRGAYDQANGRARGPGAVRRRRARRPSLASSHAAPGAPASGVPA